MNSFVLNGVVWKVRFVSPNNPMLVDRTGNLTLATTDPNINTVCVSNALHGQLLTKVLIHEIGHCALISFNLLEQIHMMVKPQYWVQCEEFMCNFIADYGMKIFEIVSLVLGNNAIFYVPYEIERFIA